ncbi:hypothetical protein Scep_024496 [Stephania cephalantha]|uniref:Uncharacterized protein n=1 Tax=Stephania cephalantha TaxID=152367 RepID=A0AAP0EXW0_9MAGN
MPCSCQGAALLVPRRDLVRAKVIRLARAQGTCQGTTLLVPKESALLMHGNLPRRGLLAYPFISLNLYANVASFLLIKLFQRAKASLVRRSGEMKNRMETALVFLNPHLMCQPMKMFEGGSLVDTLWIVKAVKAEQIEYLLTDVAETGGFQDVGLARKLGENDSRNGDVDMENESIVKVKVITGELYATFPKYEKDMPRYGNSAKVKRSARLNSWRKNTQNGVFTCSDRMPDSLSRVTRCAVGRIEDQQTN